MTTTITSVDILLLNGIKTVLLFLPYILLIGYFWFKRDAFFLKVRAETQYNIAIGLVGISFGLLMLWQVSTQLQELSFLNFSIENKNITHEITNYKGTDLLYIITSSTSNTVLLLLGTLAAILGWLCSTRSQVLNNRRNHSMQLLIESRLSERYMTYVNQVSKISNEFKLRNPRQDYLVKEYFDALTVEQKNSILYMLNYCEFIAVGIRFGDLDESLMLNTFGSMLKTNYEFSKEIIKYKQIEKKSHFEHFTALYTRWYKTSDSKFNHKQ